MLSEAYRSKSNDYFVTLSTSSFAEETGKTSSLKKYEINAKCPENCHTKSQNLWGFLIGFRIQFL
jgi:hypothetical protein